jgi:ubiquinone biosynthesis protein
MYTQAIRNIFRLKKIVSTLIHFGFGSLATELKILPFFSGIMRVFTIKKRESSLSVQERIRLVLEELGPTFVKLGQVASTRSDLLPPEWIEEFKKLQDMVAPFPYSDAKKIVEAELGKPITESFLDFDETPVASGSIAQVHFAVLKNGTQVAVKVKRPEIARIVEADISVMYTVSRLLMRHVPQARRYRPLDVVNEFSKVIQNELDMNIEGTNISRFEKMFKNDETIVIPSVHWNYTTSEILTMNRVSGIPLDEADRIRAQGLDVEKIAKNALHSFFKQVFEFGVFHADLHPGNIFARDDGAIIYLDFGIVGRLDPALRRYLASLLYHLIKRDYRKMALIHRQMGLIGEHVDLLEFEDALRDIAEPIFGRPLEEIKVSVLLMKLLKTARKFRMTLQPNLLLLQKSMVIIEGVGRQLCPEINMWEVMKPLIYKWMLKEKASPKPYIKRGMEFTEELTSIALDVPGQVHSILSATLRDELKVGFVHHRLEGLGKEIQSAGKNIAGGLIVSSLVIASSLIAIFSNGTTMSLLGLPILSTIGFVIAGIAALSLLANNDKDNNGYSDNNDDEY